MQALRPLAQVHPWDATKSRVTRQLRRGKKFLAGLRTGPRRGEITPRELPVWRKSHTLPDAHTCDALPRCGYCSAAGGVHPQAFSCPDLAICRIARGKLFAGTRYVF
ncbi:MAG: hypothetical protein ACYC3X_20840 [Pirellulaceae bacterium]